jgi:serpin B
MLHPALDLVLRHLRRAPHGPRANQPSDGHLLGRFADQRDEAAFELLLLRHGPMVWNVCRRVLGNAGDAEDAFQATFLVLVRKARSIAKRDALGCWLHGVAHRVALDARAGAARRRAHEQRGTGMATEQSPPDGAWAEVRQILDEELRRLPEKCRAPVVLCYLEGKTNDEAAELLGCSRGTLASRLSRARDLLRGRLTRRGLALTSAALAATVAANAASASVPAGLVSITLKAALSYATATGAASASAVALAEGVLRAMFMTKLKSTAAVLAALLILGAGAGWLWARTTANPPAPNPQPAPALAQPAADDTPRAKEDPARPKEDRPALVEGNTQFAFDLYAKLRQAEGNVVYSPYSISTALAMTRAGARGKTADEMDQVLHFTLPQERLHPAAGALVRDLGGADQKKRNYQLHVANALWGQKDYGFLNDFITLTRTHYDAPLTEVDFMRDREAARKTINDAVQKQTEDKIKDLLKKEHLTPATRLVLTNAIYFKAEWENKFARQLTRERPFQLTADQKVQVPLMEQMATFPHLDGDTFQLVEMPYVGKDLSMLVLLPKKIEGLPELEKALTPEKLAEWHGKLRPVQVVLFLPKFKVTGAFEMKEVLTSMGMEQAFDPQRADFSGMNGGRDSLFIQNVIHKAFVDVNEEGTEAAGATAVVLGTSGPPPKPVTFRADHPFVFLVRDNRSGSILFVGRVVDPTK